MDAVNETGGLRIRRAFSQEADALQALSDVCEQLRPDDAALVVLFCSSRFDLDVLGPEIGARITCPVLCCTTAGELDSAGLRKHGIVAAAVESDDFEARAALLPTTSDETTTYRVCEELVSGFSRAGDRESRRFALLLIDGLSMAEETTVAQVSAALGPVPLMGGSAGDDLQFERTAVYFDGAFHSNAAVLCVVQTTLPFVVFKTQHVQPTAEKIVATEADPSTRRVMEFDGDTACEVYAEALGLEPEDLSSAIMSQHPLLLRLGGESWVRSIQRVNEDGSLSFYCAIDRGVVFTLGETRSIVPDLREALEDVRRTIPKPQLILGCDCILRRLEIEAKGQEDDLAALLREWPIVGFSTYGEQFTGLHLNQTFTGLALGSAAQ